MPPNPKRKKPMRNPTVNQQIEAISTVMAATGCYETVARAVLESEGWDIYDAVEDIRIGNGK